MPKLYHTTSISQIQQRKCRFLLTKIRGRVNSCNSRVGFLHEILLFGKEIKVWLNIANLTL